MMVGSNLLWLTVVAVLSLLAVISDANPSNCKDTMKMCATWPKTKKCEEFPVAARIRCPASCKKCAEGVAKCKNKLTTCLDWPAFGYCETKREDAKVNCPLTCKLCEGPLDWEGYQQTVAEHPGCRDSMSMCHDWPTQGLCEAFPKSARIRCPLSCNVCGLGNAELKEYRMLEERNPLCRDTMSMCHDWASEGICKAFPKAAKIRCPLSCDVCEPGFNGMAEFLEKQNSKPTCRDTMTMCHDWVSKGLCKSFPRSAEAKCALSCDLCVKPVPENLFCKDKGFCASWKVTNMCVMYQALAKQHCPKICGLC